MDNGYEYKSRYFYFLFWLWSFSVTRLFLYNLFPGFAKGRKTYAIFVFTVAVSGLLLGLVLKELFQRPRPLHNMVGAGGYSFPSGHSLGGFIFSLLIIFLIWKLKDGRLNKYFLYFISAVFGILIGLSRVYLHVHYATDVLGSFFVAIGWFALIYITVYNCLQKRPAQG